MSNLFNEVSIEQQAIVSGGTTTIENSIELLEIIDESLEETLEEDFFFKQTLEESGSFRQTFSQRRSSYTLNGFISNRSEPSSSNGNGFNLPGL